MNYKDNAQALSNASVVDMSLIDDITEKFEYGDKLQPRDIINLSRIIEAFILNNEVVIREEHVVWDPTLHYNNGHDYKFTNKWIEIFSENNVIKTGRESASTLLTNEYAGFNSQLRQISGIYGNSSLEYYLSKDSEESTQTWGYITDFCGLPFITTDLIREKNDAKRFTNISRDLYERLENYYKDYFKKISKYLGPTAVRIPSLLSMVLQNSNSIEDIPKTTMQIRDKYSEFIDAVTELEYQLRISENNFEQIEIINMIENCYNNMVMKELHTKNRFVSTVLDIVQNIEPGAILSEFIKKIRENKQEINTTLLIPKYSDLWNAAGEVKQAMPLLKKVFGNQIDDEFLVQLHKRTMK